MIPALPFRIPSQHITRLLLAVLMLLPLLSGGMVHAQSASVIDVAVFYTTAAKDHEGGTEQMETKIDEMVAGANMIFADSGVNLTINLVAVEEVAYPETATTLTDFNRLKNPSDGHLDEVHTIRNRVWADIVSLLRKEGDGVSNGRAGLMTTLSTDFADTAFTVSTTVSGPATADFTHELGHVMGLYHDRYEACKHDTSNPQCPTAVRSYAYGYVNQRAFDSSDPDPPDPPTDVRWRTIMAYALSASAASCLKTFSHTPLLLQRMGRVWITRKSPNRGGKSRQGIPARYRYKTASNYIPCEASFTNYGESVIRARWGRSRP